VATNVDEANSTLGDEPPREANGGAEQLRGLVDGQQLFHDRALLWREMGKRHLRVLHGRLPSVRGTISGEGLCRVLSVAPGSRISVERSEGAVGDDHADMVTADTSASRVAVTNLVNAD
jgi:hypothetical protein